MKKLIIILGIFILSTPLAEALEGTNQAKNIEAEIRELSSLVGEKTKCNDINARINLRMNGLSSGSVVEFFKDSFRGSCLRNDVMYLEEGMDSVAAKIPRSSFACKASGDKEKIEEFVEKTKEIRQEIMCLREYGQNKDATGEEDEKCGISYNDAQYLQSKCAKSKKMFSHVKKSFNDLKETIKALMQGSSSLKDYGSELFSLPSDDDISAIQENAQNNAKDWVSQNLDFSYSGKNLELGLDWISENEQERKERISNAKKKEEPSKKVVELNGIISQVYAEIENEENEYKFAKSMGEFYIDNDIYPAIDTKTYYDLERTMQCVQYAYERTATSSDSRKPKCGENQEDCGCADPVQNDTEGIREKTKALKQLLDSHNQ